VRTVVFGHETANRLTGRAPCDSAHSVQMLADSLEMPWKDFKRESPDIWAELLIRASGAHTLAGLHATTTAFATLTRSPIRDRIRGNQTESQYSIGLMRIASTDFEDLSSTPAKLSMILFLAWNTTVPRIAA
jgi:hypothetical protein